MVEHFITWIELDLVNEVGYPEMMDYVRHCQDEEKQPGIINRYLRAVRLFFDYLNENKNDYLNPIRDYDPAKDIQIKGVQHKIRPDYLDENDLGELYENYPSTSSQSMIALCHDICSSAQLLTRLLLCLCIELL